MTSIIPFPSVKRFGSVNGQMIEATGFGQEVITLQDAMNLNHNLRIRADQHTRDGEHALARLCRKWMDELTEAWNETEGRLV